MLVGKPHHVLAAKVAVLNTACRLEAQRTEGWTCYAAHLNPDLNGASQACRGEVRRRCQLCNRRTCLQHSYACRGCESEREIEYESVWDEVNKWWDERETAASKARGEVEVPRVCHGCVEDNGWWCSSQLCVEANANAWGNGHSSVWRCGGVGGAACRRKGRELGDSGGQGEASEEAGGDANDDMPQDTTSTTTNPLGEAGEAGSLPKASGPEPPPGICWIKECSECKFAVCGACDAEQVSGGSVSSVDLGGRGSVAGHWWWVGGGGWSVAGRWRV